MKRYKRQPKIKNINGVDVKVYKTDHVPLDQKDKNKSISNFLVRDKYVFGYNELNSLVRLNKNYIAMVPNIFIQKVKGDFLKIGIEEKMGVMLFRLPRKEINLMEQLSFSCDYEVLQQMLQTKMVSRKSLFSNTDLLKWLQELVVESLDFINSWSLEKKKNWTYFKMIKHSCLYINNLYPDQVENNKLKLNEAKELLSKTQFKWSKDPNYYFSIYEKPIGYYLMNQDKIQTFMKTRKSLKKPFISNYAN